MLNCLFKEKKLIFFLVVLICVNSVRSADAALFHSFVVLPTDVLGIVFSFLHPLSDERALLLRKILLHKTMANEWACLLQKGLESSFCGLDAIFLTKRLSVYLKHVPNSKASKIQEQCALFKNNVLVLRNALYECCARNCPQKKDEPFPCLQDCDVFSSACDCDIESYVPHLSQRHFKNVEKKTVPHALALMYVVCVLKRKQNITSMVPEHLKNLLPDSFGYAWRKKHKIARVSCCIGGIACVVSVCELALFSIIYFFLIAQR